MNIKKVFLGVLFTLSIYAVQAQITPLKNIDIQKVMNYPMDEQIKRYIKDYKVDYATAKKHEQELKRWFIVGQELDKAIDMYSPEIDNFWHILLLYTKDYAQFCNDCFGRFIHHNPKKIKDADDIVRDVVVIK